MWALLPHLLAQPLEHGEVPVPREESVGGHCGRSLGPGNGGVSFQSDIHPYSPLLSSSDLLAAFCSFKPQGYF